MKQYIKIIKGRVIKTYRDADSIRIVSIPIKNNSKDPFNNILTELNIKRVI